MSIDPHTLASDLGGLRKLAENKWRADPLPTGRAAEAALQSEIEAHGLHEQIVQLETDGYAVLPPGKAAPIDIVARIKEAMLDIEEGADILMVKPASAYLDIICRLRDMTDLPIAAYQVSGEYAQIHAAGQNGWLDLKATRDEALLAIKRAGADLILTYFAKDIALAG